MIQLTLIRQQQVLDAIEDKLMSLDFDKPEPDDQDLEEITVCNFALAMMENGRLTANLLAKLYILTDLMEVL